jgi:hypothetical protein
MTRLGYWLSVLCRGIAAFALGWALAMLAQTVFPATVFHVGKAIDALPWWAVCLGVLCYFWTPWRWAWGRWAKNIARAVWELRASR